jgi:hypothetical protein
MARGTTAAGVDFAVLSARAERERQGTLLASTPPAPFRARSGREA